MIYQAPLLKMLNIINHQIIPHVSEVQMCSLVTDALAGKQLFF